MNKFLVAMIAIILVAGIFAISSVSEQLATAKSTKKIHFTQTFTSTQDPGKGHQNHQLAIILAPNQGTLYDGSLTYTASDQVEIFVLHEISNVDSKGQPIWTVDEKTVYGLTLFEPRTSSGSFEFTGSALGLHNNRGQTFTATVSVDGWSRGQPIELITQKMEIPKDEPSLKLSRSSVNATIPMHLGFFNGNPIHYIITDTNGEKHAKQITEKQNWKVELAPPLSNIPKSSLAEVYMFTNGIDGLGIFNYQNEVFSNTPSEKDEYSAIRSVIHVEWKKGQTPELLDSVEAILEAEEDGRIKLETTDVMINMPQIIWPDGQMIIREEKTLTDESPYGGGQIIEIDEENMTVTFVAHRGWGPDGRTIYYIVTDATPTGPAEMMGVVDASTLANTITSPAAIDLFQFQNGIKGTGPLGFQAGIASSGLGDENYSPLWRISLIEWKIPQDASVLENLSDINAKKSEGEITVKLARPLNSYHIVNCPFIDPFQN